MRVDLIGSPRLFGFALLLVFLGLMLFTAVAMEDAKNSHSTTEQPGLVYWFMCLVFLIGALCLLIQRPAPAAILGTVAAMIAGGMTLVYQQYGGMWAILMVVLALAGWIGVIQSRVGE
jgi:hypothetical protein